MASKGKTGLQVLSLGMSRTGTATMKEALLILGHQRVHHAYELYTYPEQADVWHEAWDRKVKGHPFTRSEWDSLLEGYTAVTDMPAVCFATDLIQAYPDAKVVLVERDEQAWYKSFSSGVIDTYFDNARVTKVISVLDHKLMRPIHKLWTRLFAAEDGFFNSINKPGMEENAVVVYRAHNAAIVANTPPGRLLRLKLGEWEPLCNFLGEEVPDVPFPRINEADAVKEVVAAFVNKSMRRAGRNLAIGIVLTSLALWIRDLSSKR